MTSHWYQLLALSVLAPSPASPAGKGDAPKPNIIFVLADDVGYGDFGCYGATKIKTPHIDTLARDGVKFTHAYSPASTSSPTRYALLTGEYAWRKKVGILPGNAPLTIDVSACTLPRLLQNGGYRTGLVGKWHLGLGTPANPVNFNGEIAPGPLEVGFDYAFFFPATNDRVPCVYIENHKVVNLEASDPVEVSYRHKAGNEPTGKENPEQLKLKHFSGHDATIVNGIGRIGWMSGGRQARWVDETMGEVFLSKALHFIETQKGDQPFFLFFAPHNAHEPRIPGAKYRGRSEAGIYGDVIEELDGYIGEILTTLKRNGLYENTLLIITSDNGPCIKQGYEDGALEHLNGHDPYNGLRGIKGSLYEGGSRVPFIVSWPGRQITPFVQSQPFCFIDLLSTLATITGSTLSALQAKDSRDASALFFHPRAKAYREYIMIQNNSGDVALRKGNWKYIPSGEPAKAELYHLENDGAERNNCIFAQKSIHAELDSCYQNDYIRKYEK
ncbi:MAG: arylsulfatase [Tannerella sp.]|jgi:arylsulfatase A-like enzyme|nr:arylsulfatase [Tannerella sp.]